jgi:hypothetical protein
MEKKSDDEFDKVYGDSIFSITEDAQFPIFNAAEAKQGMIVNAKIRSRRNKINPDDNCASNSQFPQLESNANFINKVHIAIPESNEIKIDEPLLLSREVNDPVPKFKPTDVSSPLNTP